MLLSEEETEMPRSAESEASLVFAVAEADANGLLSPPPATLLTQLAEAVAAPGFGVSGQAVCRLASAFAAIRRRHIDIEVPPHMINETLC